MENKVLSGIVLMLLISIVFSGFTDYKQSNLIKYQEENITSLKIRVDATENDIVKVEKEVSNTLYEVYFDKILIAKNILSKAGYDRTDWAFDTVNASGDVRFNSQGHYEFNSSLCVDIENSIIVRGCY